MKRSNLSRLFYIYSELYLAAFLLIVAAVELICGLSLRALGETSVSTLALFFAAFFLIIAACYLIEVYTLEKGNN